MAVESVSLSTAAGHARDAGQVPSLRHGQLLTATVGERQAEGLTRLFTQQGALDARLSIAARPGSVLTLQVERNPEGLRLIVLNGLPAQAGAGTASAPQLPPGLNLAAALQAAVGGQNSMAPLMANLAAVIGGGVELPANVHSAVERLIGFHLPADGSLDSEQLRTAILNSGIFYEARLAGGGGSRALTGDMKAVLLLLQGGLRAWLGPPPEARLGGERPPPPMRGGGPARPASAQVPADLSHLPPRDLGRLLLAQTDATLSRLRLAQMASLPDQSGAETQRGERPAQSWTFELPFAVGESTLVVQFKLSREPGAGKREGENVWRLRFSLEPETLGPVHGAVVWQRGHVAVTLWAERPEAAARLSGDVDGLRSALSIDDVAEIQVLTGRPRDATPDAGVVVDKRT